MGSPDPRQIDGIGGAHPLTSTVGSSSTPCLQVSVDDEVVSDQQACGNLLAGVAPLSDSSSEVF